MKPGRLTRKGPVRWLAPSVLVRTLAPVYFSGLFARFGDRREVQAVVDQDVVYTASGDELWVDYVVDTGDGFNATATVASQLARQTLDVGEHTTQAGELLVLGGDEVYPVASMKEYEDRFIGPFQAVLPTSEPPRTLVALPGNHDWYDGLTAFLQVFCSRQWIGGWKTVQRRSYFACQLQKGWWLWAIDMQFDTYIDQPQVEYFRAMAKKIVNKDDAIILCWAKPSWLEEDPAAQTPQDDPGWADAPKVRKGYETLDWFERRIVPAHANVRLSLTGDAHHYVRYASEDGQHKITAGLGGAFLSATHHLKPKLTKRAWTGDVKTTTEFTRKVVYPTIEKSKKLRFGVLGRIYSNQGFAALPALACIGLSVRDRPAVVVGATAAIIGATVGFSRPPRARDAWRGLVHGSVHVAVGLGAATVMRGLTGSGILRVAGSAAIGAAVGPLLFAVYMLLDDTTKAPLNTNELFAAQAIEDYKGFLRLHFRPDGNLDVYPIKVDTVTSWVVEEASPATSGRRLLRPSGQPVVALIEPRITVTRVPTAPPAP